jgi:hypothetical protein
MPIVFASASNWTRIEQACAWLIASAVIADRRVLARSGRVIGA